MMKTNDVMSRDGGLQPTNITTLGGDDVNINGSRWPFMVDRDKAWTLAFKNMAQLPREARRLTAATVSHCRAILTRPVVPVATFKFDDLALLAMGMQHEEKRCDKTATLVVDGVHFAWLGISVPLTLMHESESATLGLIDYEGCRALRFDTPTIRFVLMPCIPDEGGPGVEMLDAATMQMMQSASKGGAA